MPIDTETEILLTLTEAAKTLPGRPSVTTLWRWRTRGVRGVRLDTCAVGGRRYTSREAIQRFIAATTAAADGEPAPLRTPHERQRAIDRAERELDALGV